MSGDFSGILLLVLAAAGAVLVFDRFVLRPQRDARRQGQVPPRTAGMLPEAVAPRDPIASAEAVAVAVAVAPQRPVAPHEPIIVSYARSIFPVLLVVLLVRSFAYEPFRIPSASMMPGLVDGDFILVNKFTYGLRLPLINTKVLSIGEPQRGDVVVFRAPVDPAVNLIKRLVGLPGDHVVVTNNHLFINGAAVPLMPDGTYAGGYGFTGSELEKERFGSADHVIMLAPQRLPADFEGVVPAGHYFFMGDNRNDSEDSRFEQVGFVPEDHLVGHAIRIWMNWRIPGWPHWGRVGTRIE